MKHNSLWRISLGLLGTVIIMTLFSGAVSAQGSISGMKFNDLNNNGQNDAGEPGLANWQIILTNLTSEITTSTFTDGSGNYIFSGLGAGDYIVREVQQVGWTQTAPVPSGNYQVSLGEGEAITGIDFGNMEVTGRMTGGGSVFTTNGERVTHGFELNCNASKAPNNLQVNWGKNNKFHLESLTTATCSDDPAIAPNPPAAGFDTYTGTGTGSYNGVSGATIEWTFTDAGEPGTSDSATIVIKDSSGNIVLSVSGNLKNGNQQAHKE
ncbi:MAG: hypothetical protein O8C66_05540 [Candidatus Methanoperedens sp.]|nr:hypothetical protein [Candidatus Methanoperedens sp.]MCZ7369954.1 hypothetical protein [Candidatus Methanoperedens sp.]